MSLIQQAIRTYHQDGLGTVIRKGSTKFRDQCFRLPGADTIAYKKSMSNLRRLQNKEQGLEDILDTAYHYQGYGEYNDISPLQVRKEIKELAELVKDTSPDIVFEIGTASGGTFYVWQRYLDIKAAISLDLPYGRFGGGYSQRRATFYSQFDLTTDTMSYRRDSHDPTTFKDIKTDMEGRFGDSQLVDFLFIDGDHTYDGVKQDFKMYRQLVSEGGIIAFHDILPHPHQPDCNVDQFWDEIKSKYKTKELIGSEDQDWAGIGIVYL